MAATSEPRQREVRVFISSTFRDMHAERDHLVTVVFPELRERVEKLGLEFFDVDLRWGVPEKNADGEKANCWEYCQQWIDRVEPFFVCILGQRYGWIPAAKDFKSDGDKLRQESEPRSITDLEVRHAVLDDRKKRRSYFYLRETKAPATATEYVDPPPLSGKLEQLKNEIRSCGRPVRDYLCEWTGSGFTGMDEFGRRVLEDLWSGVLRDERYVSKDVWRQVLGADPDADPRYNHESMPVPRELWGNIVSLAKPEPKDALDAEREQMAAFATARLRWFQGRTEELAKLMVFIRSSDESAPRLAVVAAEPGQGKSALLAKLSTLILDDPSTFLITHFVGATERSSTALALVERLLGELDRSAIVWPGEENRVPDFNVLCFRLANRLASYSGERLIVILIDGLNQLSDGHDLGWLPHQLGPMVRAVVTGADTGDPGGNERSPEDDPEQRVRLAIARWHPPPLHFKLGSLSTVDANVIVVQYLAEYCKELEAEYVAEICALPQVGNPLYLLVLLGELRTLGGDDMNRIVPGMIDRLPITRPDTIALFDWLLERLEVFGADAVRLWCIYLASARAGMSGQELASLLSLRLGPEYAGVARRIERGVRRFLQHRGPQLDFFHGDLRKAAVTRYLPDDPTEFHADIASYFEAQWRGGDRHALSELPYHLLEGHRASALCDLVRGRQFLDAQRTAFPHQASLSLWTIQTAIRAGARVNDAVAMAEFAFRHARQLAEVMRQNPLNALRAASLENAWRLAAMHQAPQDTLWFLTLAWSLHVEGRTQEAAQTMNGLLSRGPAAIDVGMYQSRRQSQADQRGISEWNLPVVLLAELAPVDPVCCRRLGRMLLQFDGVWELNHAIESKAIEMARKGEYAAALSLVGEGSSETYSSDTVLSEICVLEARASEFDHALARADKIKSPWVRAQTMAQIAAAGAGERALMRAHNVLTSTEPEEGDWRAELSKDEAMATLATAELQAGDLAAAETTSNSVVSRFSRGDFLCAFAAELVRRRDTHRVRELLNDAARMIDGYGYEFDRARQLATVALFQFRLEGPAVALGILEHALENARSDSTNAFTRVQVLVDVADAQREISGNLV